MGERNGVVLIENDPDIGMLLVDVLESTGVPTTLRARPGDLTDDLQPRVVVTDLFGPDWYEREAAASFIAGLRARFLDIPIVVVTAFGEAARDGPALGADAVIEKPFDVDVLSQVVLSLYRRAEPVPDLGTVPLSP